MALVPEGATLDEVVDYDRPAEYNTKTYKINWETNQIEGYVDGIEALKQSFMLAFNTQRYKNHAFTSNYGMDWQGLIGMPEDYIISEVLTRVQDMVLADKRFLSVEYYEDDPYTIEGDAIYINLDIKTVEGDFTASVTVGG